MSPLARAQNISNFSHFRSYMNDPDEGHLALAGQAAELTLRKPASAAGLRRSRVAYSSGGPRRPLAGDVASFARVRVSGQQPGGNQPSAPNLTTPPASGFIAAPGVSGRPTLAEGFYLLAKGRAARPFGVQSGPRSLSSHAFE